MTVRLYKSTDASAPVLNGNAGSLVTVLDAILVNGYGTQTAAGWTINQTAANKRGYKQNTTGSNNTAGMCLYVDDTGPGGAGTKEARACGFETMTAITPTGTGQFPSGAQSGVGIGTLVIRKSNTADATARAWTCIANGQTIYLFIESGDFTSPLAAPVFVFGDFKPYKTGDQYAVGIIGRQDENQGNGAANYENFQLTPLSNRGQSYTLQNAMRGHYVARHWTGVGGSKACGKTFDYGRVVGNNTYQGSWASDTGIADNYNNCYITYGRYATTGAPTAPNGPDNSLLLSSMFINHSGSLRGYWPGLWVPLQDKPINHNDTFSIASGGLSGKSMIAQAFPAMINGNNSSENGLIIVETSDTWS